MRLFEKVAGACALVCLTLAWDAIAFGQSSILSPEAIPPGQRDVIRQALEAAGRNVNDSKRAEDAAREFEQFANQLTRRVERAIPSDPLTGPVVTGAPFSADALTTVTHTLGDGTRIERGARPRSSTATAPAVCGGSRRFWASARLLLLEIRRRSPSIPIPVTRSRTRSIPRLARRAASAARVPP
jgi:hypothetical protein